MLTGVGYGKGILRVATHRLLGISGSLRKASTNTQLLREAARVYDPASFDLADLNMPLYNGDLEEASGLPEAALKLKAQIAAADAVLIAAPEYNSNIPGVLKNALDWVSRGDGAPFADKPVAIMSAAAGRTGGARTQVSLRMAMTPFGPRILQKPEVMIAMSFNAFDESGQLKDARSKTAMEALMTALRAEVARS